MGSGVSVTPPEAAPSLDVEGDEATGALALCVGGFGEIEQMLQLVALAVGARHEDLPLDARELGVEVDHLAGQERLARIGDIVAGEDLRRRERQAEQQRSGDRSKQRLHVDLLNVSRRWPALYPPSR